MKKLLFVVWVGALFFLTNRLSYADFDASTCFSACNSANLDCLAQIDPFYAKELSYIKDDCNKAKSECFNKCDNERNNDTREKTEMLLQQQKEQPPQEQQPQEQPPEEQPPQEQPSQEQQ